MQAALTVRAARDSDARAVVDLLVAEDLEASFDPSEFIVAESEGRVVACARLRTFPTGAHELASVAVARDQRRAGVGSHVVRAALERATGAVYALAVAPDFFATLGFTRLIVMPDELRAKAEGMCASKAHVAMRWVPSREAAVTEIKRRYAAASACCESLGSGEPVDDAALAEGEVVVDLGSGAGHDAIAAARAVGPRGRSIGIDFTPEMVARAREHAASAGVSNVEFHESPIEQVPLPDASADVVVSNCVINLSLDKAAVLREAHRVLRPGGRFVVSDTLRADATAPATTPSCDCVTGALSAREWRALLAEAGFVDVRVDEGAPLAGVATATVRARRA